MSGRSCPRLLISYMFIAHIDPVKFPLSVILRRPYCLMYLVVLLVIDANLRMKMVPGNFWLVRFKKDVLRPL